VSYAYRSWRREWRGEGKRFNGGTLVWQSNDCWPVASWAIIDYFLRPKPIYYTIKRELAEISVGISRTVHQDRVHDRPRQFHEFGAFQSTSSTIEIWGTNSSLQERRMTLDVQYYDLSSLWRSEESHTVTLLSNQTTELISKECPHRARSGDDLVTPASSVIIHARLIDLTSGVTVARYSDWPQPFRYIDFPDPQLRIKRFSSESSSDRKIVVIVDKPAKCVMLSTRETGALGEYGKDGTWGDSVKWDDNALDLFPGDDRVVKCPGLLNDTPIWVSHMGSQNAFKIG